MHIWLAVPRAAQCLVWLLPQAHLGVRGESQVRRQVYRPDRAGFMAVHPLHAAELVRQGCVLVDRAGGGDE